MKVLLVVSIGFCSLAVFFTNCAQVGSGGAGEQALQSTGKTCYPGPGATGSPKTIEEAVTLINSLPKPVTITCFIESLDRPLDLFATFSASSAQPAGGQDNPRFFLFKGGLAMSVVPTGAGKNMVEFGQKTAVATSLKGELEFPIVDTIPLSLPFDRIRYGSGTACRFCHTNETTGSLPNSFESELIRPDPQLVVTLPEIQVAYNTCDPKVDPYRCEIFKAILSYGQVRSKNF